MTCRCCRLSPFRWAEFPAPSMFSQDAHFFKGAGTGKTMNTLQTEAVTRFEQKNGRSAGTIRGLSDKGDAQIEEAEHRRTRSASHYGRNYKC